MTTQAQQRNGFNFFGVGNALHNAVNEVGIDNHQRNEENASGSGINSTETDPFEVFKVDTTVATQSIGDTAAEGLKTDPAKDSYYTSTAPDPIPVLHTEQAYISSDSAVDVADYVEAGDSFYPYKVQAPSTEITHDFTGVNQTVAGSTLGRNLLFEQKEMYNRNPLFGWAPKNVIPHAADAARGFIAKYKLPQPNISIQSTTIPLHPLGSRNPVYPVPVQHMRGVTDPDFRLPKYGNGETHGLVTAGGHVLDEDEFILARNGVPKSKPHRAELASQALIGPTTSHSIPLGAQDLVIGSLPLYQNEQPLSGQDPQGQPTTGFSAMDTGANESIAVMNQYTQRGFPTYCGPDNIFRDAVDDEFSFAANWQNHSADRLTEGVTGVPGSVYNSAQSAVGETGSCRSATMYRPTLDVIGVDQFPNRPFQWTGVPGSGMEQNLALAYDIITSAPSGIDMSPQYQYANDGDAFSLVPCTNSLVADSQNYYSLRDPYNCFEPANPMVEV